MTARDTSFRTPPARNLGAVARLSAGLLAAVAAAWLCGAFTVSMVNATRAPDRAIAAWHTSLALSGQAARLMKENPPAADIRRAAMLSRQALAISPVNVEAARTLALADVLQNRSGQARTLIRYAQTLSRRDVPTQMWLIEDRVAADDTAGVLIHYHRAMQTSRASRALLSPILAQAADDPAVLTPLAPILRTRPEWWSDFLGDFVERTHSPRALDIVTRALRLDPAVDVERERLSSILQRYVVLGEVQAGRRLFDRLTGAAGSATPVVQGGFERDFALPPFGWQLAETTASAGTREARTGATGDFALTLDGNEGQEAARQLLTLAPGSYDLRARVGAVRPGLVTAPMVAIHCADSTDRLIEERAMPIAQPVATMTLRFVVAAGCSSQWLIVSTARAHGYLDEQPWIDDVAVVPTGRAGSVQPVRRDGR